jgi:hypothetical protein
MRLAVVAVGLFIFLAVLWLLTRKRGPSVRQALVERHDAELGSYVLEFTTTNHSKSGIVTFNRDIQGSLCRFVCQFDASAASNDEVEQAIQKLRYFYGFARHPERMKVYRNALLEVVEFHKALYPLDAIDENEVRRNAQLINVEVIDDDAYFTFVTTAFLRGRPINVRVKQNGDTDFTGVA